MSTKNPAINKGSKGEKPSDPKKCSPIALLRSTHLGNNEPRNCDEDFNEFFEWFLYYFLHLYGTCVWDNR